MNLFDYLAARSIRNENIDLLIAKTQRSISTRTLLVIAGVLAALFLLPTIDPVVEKLLLVVLGALMSNWATQTGFWYGRPRGSGIPDPSLTETKTTETKTTESVTASKPVAVVPAVPQPEEPKANV